MNQLAAAWKILSYSTQRVTHSRVTRGWVAGLGLSLVLTGGLVGCQPKADTAATPGSAVTATKPAETPTPAAFLEQMPSELKHDGFAYSGLSNSKPARFRMTSSDGKEAREGEQTSNFIEMRDGTAVFQVVRSGDLADLGTDELAVAADGVYALKTSLGELDTRSLEMPSDPNAKKSWSNQSKLTRPDGQVVTITGNYRVVGTEKVTTPAGTWDALVLTAEGPIKIGDTSLTMRAKSWYVKDLGVVKQTIERRQANSAPVTVTLEMIPTP